MACLLAYSRSREHCVDRGEIEAHVLRDRLLRAQRGYDGGCWHSRLKLRSSFG